MTVEELANKRYGGEFVFHAWSFGRCNKIRF